VHEVSLSTLTQTEVVVDLSRYPGLYLFIKNDFPSDIFLKIGPPETYLPVPRETKAPFRLRDLDEAHRRSRGFMTADEFMFVWSGNNGFIHHLFDPRLSPGKNYFLPITYYHCKDGGFYVQSLRIVTVDKKVQRNAN
jgi:hypothetical protein